MPRVLEFDREYTVVANDTLTAIIAAQCSTITFEELAKFNWGGSDHDVNRMLRETIGVKTLANDSSLSVLDPVFGKTDKLRIPKLFVRNALTVEQIHTLTVKRRLPATAVAISKLDKWFIPQDEVCDLTYRAEGIPERADKSKIEVYASNYCTATPVEENGLVSCTYAALDSLANPVWTSPDPVTANMGAPKNDYPIADWRGESNAAAGMLKPRAKTTQHIN